MQRIDVTLHLACVLAIYVWMESPVLHTYIRYAT